MGIKERLSKARKKKEKIKILFEYPNSNSVKVRRGYVKSIGKDSFEFDEIKEGLITYSYKYIVEVSLA